MLTVLWIVECLRTLILEIKRHRQGFVKVDVHQTQDDQNKILSVKDSGIGMTPEESAKIWERFYSTNASKKFVKDSRLGLSIVMELVEMHEGILTVESELGE